MVYKVVSSVPRQMKRGCLHALCCKKNPVPKTHATMNTPRAGWLHFERQQMNKSSSMLGIGTGLSEHAPWAETSGCQGFMGMGRSCRLWPQWGVWEEGQTPWASGFDRHAGKTLPRVQRLSPWLCFVWKSHCLNKADSISSFRGPTS